MKDLLINTDEFKYDLVKLIDVLGIKTGELGKRNKASKKLVAEQG